jgi:hypothetical protein
MGAFFFLPLELLLKLKIVYIVAAYRENELPEIQAM